MLFQNNIIFVPANKIIILIGLSCGNRQNSHLLKASLIKRLFLLVPGLCLSQENIYFRIVKRIQNIKAFFKGFFLLIKIIALTLWYYLFKECKTLTEARNKALSKLFAEAIKKSKRK